VLAGPACASWVLNRPAGGDEKKEREAVSHPCGPRRGPGGGRRWTVAGERRKEGKGWQPGCLWFVAGRGRRHREKKPRGEEGGGGVATPSVPFFDGKDRKEGKGRGVGGAGFYLRWILLVQGCASRLPVTEGVKKKKGEEKESATILPRTGGREGGGTGGTPALLARRTADETRRGGREGATSF